MKHEEQEKDLLKSGIYTLKNKLNGRIYIGSAKRFRDRWHSHRYCLKTNKHSNCFLQADYNKCGPGAFLFKIVELTDDKSKEERLLIEEKWIEQYYDSGHKCYNLCKRAFSREGCRDKNTKETKERKRKAGLKNMENPEFRNRSIESLRINLLLNGPPNLGNKHSTETKKIMSDKHIGKLKSEETKRRMSEAQSKRAESNPSFIKNLYLSSLESVSKPIIVRNKITGEIIRCISKTATCKEFGFKNTKQLKWYIDGKWVHDLYEFYEEAQEISY